MRGHAGIDRNLIAKLKTKVNDQFCQGGTGFNGVDPLQGVYSTSTMSRRPIPNEAHMTCHCGRLLPSVVEFHRRSLYTETGGYCGIAHIGRHGWFRLQVVSQ